MTTMPVGGEFAQDRVDRELGADVDADGGAVEERRVWWPAMADDALLVAARQGVDGVGRVGGDDFEARHPFLFFGAGQAFLSMKPGSR